MNALPLGEPGSISLDHLIGEPLDLATFLRLARSIAAAVRALHARGLIHRDVTPANILVDAEGRAALAGSLGATLSHLAPERTGRMNRSTDSRSDLYSVGVTFYQMLTHALPFVATTPIEWMHSHIARPPLPPTALRPELPEVLSRLVLKLLAKAAEDRYQTAAGLEVDLQRCAESLEKHGRIEAFPLGARDVSDRLLIPETLYGRETEIATLRSAFERVARSHATELVLVSGYSGVGKSSVVHELQKALVPSRGLFASGKFDQYKRGVPYVTLAQAFQQLARQILAQSDEEVARWRTALQDALGANGQLIVSLVSEIEHIIGPQPPVIDLPPPDTKSRFQRVLRAFIGTFARPEHPLTLFLDDLQWLDAATLELLEHLLSASDVGSLLLIGAYRDNEVGSAHPLARTLADMKLAGGRISHIVLAPLALGDVESIVEGSLRCDRAAARPLAKLIAEKTGGNPFFTIQFLVALTERDLLTFSHDRLAWAWDLERIRAERHTDNVVALMSDKLGRLPATARNILQRFACLGNVTELGTLAAVCEEDRGTLERRLEPALEAGVVTRIESRVSFLHDRVHEAAYALVPEGQRAALHLRIGRILGSIATDEENVFEIVSQLNRGASLIVAAEERERVAHLDLVAARRAKAATAYDAALAYLRAGRALATSESVISALEFASAECEFLTGQPALAEARLLPLARRVESIADRARVAGLQILVYTGLDQSDRAIAVCLEYLRAVGIDWPLHPAPELVTAEYEAIRAQIGARGIEELIDLPRMTSAEHQATMDVLTAVGPASLSFDASLNGLMACRMVNLSLEHGYCDASVYAYIIFAMNLGPRFGRYDEAFRFGRLALELADTRGFTTYKARALMCFGNMLSPWQQHVRLGQPLVRRAFEVARESGDLMFAVYSCYCLVTNMLTCGDPLDDVKRAAEDGMEFARKAQMGLGVDFITPQSRLIDTLRGRLPKFGYFDDASFDEASFERHLRSNPSLSMARCWYAVRKLQARFHAGAIADAIAASADAATLLWTSPSFLEICDYHFYTALTLAAACDDAAPEQQSEYLDALRGHHAELESEARYCPENFENRALLVGAEVARLERRTADAMKLYERALTAAREQGFVANEALASELAAAFYGGLGSETAAEAHRERARDGYSRWGAIGKVEQLAHRHPSLRATGAMATDTSIGQLDFTIAVSMSLAISGEIVLDRLIEKLMVLALEHAGAVRGLLVRPEGDALRIEAEATTGRAAVAVQVRRDVATPDELPETILRFVTRSLDSVILNDALAPNEFSSDPYLSRKHVRSVLCLPLVKQGKLLGILYLENDLSAFVFTPPRIIVLQLLASQAAISLENARLYQNNQTAHAELAHVTRVTTMGELVGSITHEVSQPISGIVLNGKTSLRWLDRGSDDPENLVEARAATDRIVRDGLRAAAVLDRLRKLFKKRDIVKERLDLNEAIEEALTLVRGEVMRRDVMLRQQLNAESPIIIGDRVQLQQVVMNLVLNAVDATSQVRGRAREIIVGTRRDGVQVVAFVSDSGIGLDPSMDGKLFTAFQTTKKDGLGMGLSISRSIVENHDGRLWASSNPDHGATFQFELASA